MGIIRVSTPSMAQSCASDIFLRGSFSASSDSWLAFGCISGIVPVEQLCCDAFEELEPSEIQPFYLCKYRCERVIHPLLNKLGPAHAM